MAPVLLAGNAVRDGVLRGRTGASGDGLTWPAARGGSVQGVPCGHYGPCVLDEHIGGAGGGRVVSADRGEVFWLDKARTQRRNRSRAADRAETEIAGGARKPRHV